MVATSTLLSMGLSRMPPIVFLLGTLGVSSALVVPTARPMSMVACPRVAASFCMSANNPPPPEVIEAERNATPNRKYRLLGAGALIALCSASASLSAAKLSGVGLYNGIDVDELADSVLLFNNPYISLLVDVVLGGTCAWAWQQELATRDENVARIWEEVQQRRRTGGRPTGSGANRFERRARAKEDAAASKTAKGFGSSTGATPPSPPPTPPPPTPPSPQAADSAAPGLFSGVQGFFDEANALAKANAIALNDELESA